MCQTIIRRMYHIIKRQKGCGTDMNAFQSNERRTERREMDWRGGQCTDDFSNRAKLNFNVGKQG